MVSDHEQWIAQAVELARRKRFDEARELALQVIREDARNPKALWIVASTTESLNERRNALRALLRIQPDNLHAQQMLDSIDQQARTTSSKTSTAIRSIKPDSATPTPQHMLLYTAVVLAALVIVATVIIAAKLV